MKKLLLVVLVLMCLSGCANSKAKYTVGIIQLVKHEALDKATQGFIDELKNELGEDVYILDPQVASGNVDTCNTIASGLVADGVDLIMGNATAALLSAANATKQVTENRIPVLGTSITDYGAALDLKNFNGLVGSNVSGTSDLAPLDAQAQMIVDLFPQAKTISLLYCQAEANSKFQVENIEKYLLQINSDLIVEKYSFTETNEIQAVADSACENADVLYIPTDNACASNGQIIATVASSKNVPIIAGEQSTLLAVDGVATFSIDYYELGKLTGKMAVQILTNQVKIEEMEIKYYENPTKLYIKKNADKYGLIMPEDYTAIEE